MIRCPNLFKMDQCKKPLSPNSWDARFAHSKARKRRVLKKDKSAGVDYFVVHVSQRRLLYECRFRIKDSNAKKTGFRNGLSHLKKCTSHSDTKNLL